jgi:hypothetical protein
MIGATIGLRALRVQEEIAEKSGAFEKPAMQVLFAGMLNANREYNVAVGSPFEPSSLTSIALPFSVESVGQRSVEDLYVQFRYHQGLKLMVDEAFVTSQSNLLGSGSRKTDRVDPFEYSTFHFDKMHPGVRINIGEPIIIRETRFVDEITAETRDKKQMNMKYAVEYSYQIGVSVTAQDLKSQDYMLSVSGIKASNLDNLIGLAVKSIERNCVNPAHSSLSDWIFGTNETRETSDLILLYPHRSLIAKSEGISFFNAEIRSGADVALLTYPKEGNFAILQRPGGKEVVLSLSCRDEKYISK